MTFKERFSAGDCTIDTIEDWVNFWHEGNTAKTLLELLGLTDEEYGLWLAKGDCALAREISDGAETAYMAVHITWEDLHSRLSELVNSLLGFHYTIGIERSDFYYWDMVLHCDKEIDEKRSKYICEKLDLRDIDVEHFLNSNTIDKSQLRGLLEKLLQHEVVSSHADDEGVWIFYKALHASSKGWADAHIEKYERRLRTEIGSRRYPVTNKETAAHQLYGYVKALQELGLVADDEHVITLEHFSNMPEAEENMENGGQTV